MNKVLVITGMHRSGTSLISQWLYKCGLHIGTNFLGPQVGNTEGHFEDIDFLHLHEELLQNNLLVATGLTDAIIPELSDAEKEKIKNIIGDKNRLHKQWGWKDPRTCLFYPITANCCPMLII